MGVTGEKDMMKKILYGILAAAILFGVFQSHCGKNPVLTRGAAEQILFQYTLVLAGGDSSGTMKFWSGKSLKDPAFWYMHAAIGLRLVFSDWPAFLEAYSPHVKSVRSGRGDAVIEMEWIPDDTVRTGAPKRLPMRFYMIRENGQWVFINPIDLLTAEWQTFEGNHFIYHFPKELRLEDHRFAIQANEDAFSRILEFFNLELPQKLRFYVARTA